MNCYNLTNILVKNDYNCIVKYFIYILATLMFTVILVPCTDSVDVNHRLNENIAQHLEHKNSHGHEHNEKDTCSPFCYCQCCSVASLTPIDFKEFKVKPLIVTISQQNSLYENHYSYGEQSKLLQPPRA